MKTGCELELQAYADGELSAWRASRVRRRLAKDPEARQLVEELQMTRAMLKGNELDRPLAEEPHFYWNQIQQRIHRLPAGQEEPAEQVTVSWRRLLAPIAGVAMAVFLGIALFNSNPSIPGDDAARIVAEVENLSEDTDSFSFRSASENMFVVWVHDKTGSIQSDADFMDEEDF